MTFNILYYVLINRPIAALAWRAKTLSTVRGGLGPVE
jgi:hypothetical protein